MRWLLIGALAIACATPYQPKGFRGGYTDFEIQPGIYYVAFEGNGYIGRPGVVRYWHHRAAEICGGSGLYVVLSLADITTTTTVTTPATANATTTQTGPGTWQTQIRSSPGSATTVRKPAEEGYIRCKEVEPDKREGDREESP